MSATKAFLAGKLTLKTLLSTDQPANRPEIVARLLSPGGELTVLADGVTAIRHLAYVELRPGKVRGNHFHKFRHESFYLINGELELQAKDIATGEQISTRMQTGDLALIAPRVLHSFVPVTGGHALEYAPEPFDAADVYREAQA